MTIRQNVLPLHIGGIRLFFTNTRINNAVIIDMKIDIKPAQP